MLAWISAGLLAGVAVAGLLHFALGFDLLAAPVRGLPCPLHTLTGIACPGCGMTRALVLVSQLQWLPALRMNALVFLLLGFAALFVGEQFGSQPSPTQPRATTRAQRISERLALPALGLVAAHWIYTIVT